MQHAEVNQYIESQQFFEEALAIYQAIQDRRGVAWALNYLGEVYRMLTQYEKAITYYQRALPLYQLVQDRDGEARTLGHLGLAYEALLQYDKAIIYFLQALPLFQANKNHRGEAEILSQLGFAYNNLSQFEKAIEYHEQSLGIAREIKDRQKEGGALGGLGLVYFSLDNYGKAIEYHEQSLAIAREIKDRQGGKTALGNLGIVYFSLGNYSKAIEYHEQSLAIAREIKDRLGEGTALGNLGIAYSSLGNYGKAIEYHEQRLAIAREIKDRLGEGASLGNLGIAYSSLGNYGKAIEYHEQSLAIAGEIKDRRGEGTALGNLGNAYLSLGNYGKAIKFREQSLAIAREIKDRRGEGTALNNLGATLFKAGNLAAAAKILIGSIVTWERLRQTGAGNDANKVSIFEQQARTYRTLQQVLVAQNQPNVALEIAERGRARAFVELLAKRIGSQGSGFGASAQPSGVGSQEGIKPPTIAQLQQIAKAQNASLVQYSIIFDDIKTQAGIQGRESELYIWVIQPTGEITFRKADLKPLWQQQNASLEKLVEQSRETIGARGRSDVGIVASAEVVQQRREQQLRNLKQLHQLLIKPIADLLPKDPNQRVIFMPQGELFLVPFPALLDTNNTALIEKHTIQTAPSIQVLELTHQRKKGIGSREWGVGKSLVVGNPLMPKVRTEAGGSVTQLNPLAGSEWEAKEIADLLKTKAIIGSQATKSNILKQLSQARFIHFATHGLLDDFKGLGVPGAIALAPDNTGKVNDGLLTSDEILDLKLNAELVVLSACDTGRGRLTGDGVIGLSRSLITAGVPSIIVSLWKVPDQSTAFLMTQFYKNLQQNPDKAQALRQAMLSTKAKYPDPLDWAAFTLIGESQ
ncbi:MAG: CHAT domain-containing tetratricopeptide repeat protein [Leptolyngbyaceae cyanobacterium bins.349]|nr:CHAT domain-containing tetratricopeptide repeat protein [Leptolyngbyaceae cyanobacterium bins.349]